MWGKNTKAARAADGDIDDAVAVHDSDFTSTETSATAPIAVGVRVRCQRPDLPANAGMVVDDYGGYHGVAVAIGEHHFVDAARRWAVALDSGELIFADTDELEPLPSDGDENDKDEQAPTK